MTRPTLETYIAESGQWAGIVRQDGEEIARIAGCETLDDVLAAAAEQWPDIEHIDLPDALPGLWRAGRAGRAGAAGRGRHHAGHGGGGAGRRAVAHAPGTAVAGVA